MQKRLPTIIVLLVLAGVSAWVAWTWWKSTQAESGTGTDGSPEAAPIAVEVAPAGQRTVRDVRVLTGTLEAGSRFVVAAKVGGLLERMLVDIGDPIEPGQVVAEIDDAELRQGVLQAEADLGVREAELARARSDLGLAQREFERGEQLRAQGIAGVAQLDEIQARLRAAEATVRLAEAQVESARSTLNLRIIELGRTRVRAEWSGEQRTGVVAERYQDAGNTVQANAQIVSVVSLDPIKSVVFVTERDYARMSVGQRATVTTDATGTRVFEGRIVRVAPVFRDTSRQARVELSIANPDGALRPGMFARVRVVLDEQDYDTVVPLAGVVERDGRDVVFVVDDDAGTVRRVAVDTGITEGAWVGIESPAITGSVVVLGHQLLEDGSRVRVTNQPEGEVAPDPGGAGGP